MRSLLLAVIRAYQHASVFHTAFFKMLFMTDTVCRFHPTCSDYTYQAIDKYGSIRGSIMGLKRIVRCHPWAAGGFDPVK